MTRKSEVQTCPTCGARLAEGVDTCGLCGTSIGAEQREPVEEESVRVSGRQEKAPGVSPAQPAAGPYCNQCGWQNPAGARFCSQCGTPLQVLAKPAAAVPGPRKKGGNAKNRERSAPPAAAPAATPQQQRLKQIVVAASVLLALGVYLINQVEAENTVAASTTVQSDSDHSHSGALSVETAQRAMELEEQIKTLEGAERLSLQRELVQLFASAGRFDRAAVEQEKVAQEENTVENWVLTGNYFYDWAATTTPEQRAEPVKRAIDAYQKVLAEEPGNNDVRTDMAALYQWDPEKTSLAIEETQRVLDSDPNHVQANFNMGIFLMRNEQMEEAIGHFNRVMEIEPPGSPTYQRAQEILSHVEEHTRQASF